MIIMTICGPLESLPKMSEPKLKVILRELKLAKVSSGMGLPMLREMSIQRHKFSSYPVPPSSLYLF